MNPMVNSVVNRVLEMKLRQVMRLDPFWQEKLVDLNGIRLKVVLTDTGFKRVFQFGPTDLHLVPPFTGAYYTLTTRMIHLPKLLDQAEFDTASTEGHIAVTGYHQQFEGLMQILRSWQLDWEMLLSQALPDPLAHHLVSAVGIMQAGVLQTGRSMTDSYRFWRDNEIHSNSSR